jgi:hypothetical protein
MSREATEVILEARLPLALPEKPKRESRGEQRSEVAKSARGKFQADPSKGERITDFGDDAEVQSGCGCVAGSFDKIAYAARPFAVGVAEVVHCYSEENFELLLRGGDFLFRLGLWNRREAEMRKSVGADLLAGRKPVTDFSDIHRSVGRFAAGPNIPMVGASNCIGHQKLGGCESLMGEHWPSVAKNRAASIIKPQHRTAAIGTEKIIP